MGVPVTTHAGVYGITLDAGVRHMYENGFCTPQTVYVHSASLSPDSYHMIAATGGSVSVSTESECSAGQGYPPTWKLRKYGIPVSLSQDTSVWWSGDIFSAMRATLSADRVMDHFENHNEGKAVTNHHLRAEQVVDWATRGGAKAIGLDSSVGSVEEGKKADLVLIKNDDSPVSFPILNPYGHVVFQAQRGDVHTVVVNGRVVKFDHKLVDVDLAKARRAIDETTEYLRSELGEQAWAEGMNPEVPEHEQLANPYTYTGAAAWKEDASPSGRLWRRRGPARLNRPGGNIGPVEDCAPRPVGSLGAAPRVSDGGRHPAALPDEDPRRFELEDLRRRDEGADQGRDAGHHGHRRRDGEHDGGRPPDGGMASDTPQLLRRGDRRGRGGLSRTAPPARAGPRGRPPRR